MADSNKTSADQLDNLLAEGKISQEDYETLRHAMDERAREDTEQRRVVSRRRLTKSWTNRQLGGVCAGIAERFDMEVWRVRLIFVLGFLFTGGLALFVYLALFFTFPWKEKERPVENKFPWGFATAVWDPCLRGASRCSSTWRSISPFRGKKGE